MNAESDSVQAEPEAQAGASRHPGRILREARIAANLAQGEVASRLNLTVTFVDALERDATGELPSAVFVRGYIKNYARLLDLPTGELVALYDAQRAPDEAHDLRPRVAVHASPGRRGGLPRAILILVVVVAVGALTAWWLDAGDGVSPTGFLARLLPQDEAMQAPIVEPAPMPAPQAPVSAAPASRVDTPATPLSPAVVDEPGTGPAVDANPVAAPPSIAPVSTTSAPPVVSAPKPPPAPTGDRLLLTVRHDAWIEVTDSAGERLVFDILTSGTRREVAGEAPFTVLLGRAEAVDVTYNDRPVDHTAHHRKGIARFLVEEHGGEVVTRAP